MPDYEPAPPFEVSAVIKHMMYDNAKQRVRGGKGHARYGAVQRVDAAGETINQEAFSIAYVAMYDLPVPDAMVRLTWQDRALRAERGPYTQDFARLLPVVAYIRELPTPYQRPARAHCDAACQAAHDELGQADGCHRGRLNPWLQEIEPSRSNSHAGHATGIPRSDVVSRRFHEDHRQR